MKLAKLFLAAALFAGFSASYAAQPKVVAHRGYWDTPGSAQNSIRSLVKADSIGCYASEFDFWATADSVLVVNHDPTINGYVIEQTPSSVILQQKLSNGEYIPTVEQYFQAAAPLKINLVCELKPHDGNALERHAIAKVLELVKKYGLEDRMSYITFSKNGFVNLCKSKDIPKGTSIQFLNGDFLPEQIKFMKGTGIDYSIKAMRKHPEWFKECHDLGLTVNVWTVNKPEDMQWCIENGADFITTNDPEGLMKMLAK